mgnify:CR=1 FL=1
MLNLMDQGQASKVTRGFLSGLFTESGTPPYNRFNCAQGLNCNPLLCPPHTCETPTGPVVPDDIIPHDVDDKVF